MGFITFPLHFCMRFLIGCVLQQTPSLSTECRFSRLNNRGTGTTTGAGNKSKIDYRKGMIIQYYRAVFCNFF